MRLVRPLRYVIDANVLIDAQLRDLFLRCHEARLLTIVVSEQILGEVEGWFRKHRTAAETSRFMTAIRSHLRPVLPTAVVVDQIDRDRAILPDPHDRHVLAAATHAGADGLVTINIRDFPERELERFNIELLSPDEACCDLLRASREELLEIVREQAEALRAPPMTLEDFLGRLHSRAPLSSVVLGDMAGIERFSHELSERQRVEDPRGPWAIVGQFLDAITEANALRCWELLHTELRETLRERVPVDQADAQDVMLDRWIESYGSNPHERWGFGSGNRPSGPAEEWVLLVPHPSAESRRITEPEVVEARTFRLRLDGNDWRIVSFDEIDPYTRRHMGV